MECSTHWPATKTARIANWRNWPKSEAEIGDAKVAILKGVLAEEAKSGEYTQNRHFFEIFEGLE